VVERRTCYQEVVGLNFESRPGSEHKNSAKVFYTYVPLSPSSISWYWPMGSDAWRLGRWLRAWWNV